MLSSHKHGQFSAPLPPFILFLIFFLIILQIIFLKKHCEDQSGSFFPSNEIYIFLITVERNSFYYFHFFLTLIFLFSWIPVTHEKEGKVLFHAPVLARGHT